MGLCLDRKLCAGAFVLLAASGAGATEICVKCSGPDASYACVVNTSSNGTIDTVTKLFCITALAKAGSHASCTVDRSTTAPCQGQRKEFAIPAVLDDGSDEPPQHDASAPPGSAQPSMHSSSMDAPASGSVMPGAVQDSHTLPAAANGGPGDQAQDPSRDPSLAPAHEAAAEPPPKTVQEMLEKSTKSAGDGIADTQKSAGEAAKSAGTALAKAGTAVGNAAKNSWKCLSSFFSNC